MVRIQGSCAPSRFDRMKLGCIGEAARKAGRTPGRCRCTASPAERGGAGAFSDTACGDCSTPAAKMQAAALAETQNSPCQAGEGGGTGAVLLCASGKRKEKEEGECPARRARVAGRPAAERALYPLPTGAYGQRKAKRRSQTLSVSAFAFHDASIVRFVGNVKERRQILSDSTALPKMTAAGP